MKEAINTTPYVNKKPYELQLEHRLAMINDDLNELRIFINEMGMTHIFENKQSRYAPSGITHLNNIEIATDLKNNECLEWKLYKHADILKVDSIIKTLRELNDGAGVDGETMEYILAETAMTEQMLHQLKNKHE
jgi:hypothetical protein